MMEIVKLDTEEFNPEGHIFSAKGLVNEAGLYRIIVGIFCDDDPRCISEEVLFFKSSKEALEYCKTMKFKAFIKEP
jgi:hypothetical protein